MSQAALFGLVSCVVAHRRCIVDRRRLECVARSFQLRLVCYITKFDAPWQCVLPWQRSPAVAAGRPTLAATRPWLAIWPRLSSRERPQTELQLQLQLQRRWRLRTEFGTLYLAWTVLVAARPVRPPRQPRPLLASLHQPLMSLQRRRRSCPLIRVHLLPQSIRQPASRVARSARTLGSLLCTVR
jgi:hypothetical protein